MSYKHQNHLGSPVAATNNLGAVSWREHWTPFGEKLVDPSGNQNDEGFTGHIDDAEIGMTYMQARYMDPILGRFLSGDPVGFTDDAPQMFNRYSYTLNDPVNLNDPDGNIPVAIAACAASPACATLVVAGVVLAVKTGGDIVDTLKNDSSSGGGNSNSGNSGNEGPKVNPDKQGKHQPGHKNFQPGKSEVTHPDPQGLVDDKAGTGEQVGDTPVGEAGSKERIDFGETIGTHVDGQTGERSETTVGIIHYAKEDVHIVPAAPKIDE